MKLIFSGITAFILMFFQATAEETNIPSTVESVTIYHSGALVVRTSEKMLQAGMHELIFKNISSKIVLNSLKFSNKEVTILNKSVIRKLTKEEFSQLQDRKDALENEQKMIESKAGENAFIANVEDLEKMTAFYALRIVQIKRDLRQIDEQIAEANKLESIELKNEHAAILKLIVSIDGNLKDKLLFQYVCGGIGWSPAYEVLVKSSAEKSVEIKYQAKVMSQTGEDWEKVRMHLSSSFPLESPTNLPSVNTPWVLNGNGFNANSQQGYSMQNQQYEQQHIDRLDGIEYQDIRIPSFLKLRTLNDTYSLKSNSTVFTFPIQSVQLDAYYYYFAFPSVDPDVYLVAEITGWDSLGFVDGIANLTYGSNDVGKSVIKFSESRDTLLLPVGKDNSVFLKRSEIGDQKYFKEKSIGKKKETTLAYRFELKNNNPFPVHFELIDQIPISQTKSAEVEVLNTSGGKLNKENGEVRWDLNLKEGQSIDKELIFSIEMDGNFVYSKGPSRTKYRTVSCPTF